MSSECLEFGVFRVGRYFTLITLGTLGTLGTLNLRPNKVSIGYKLFNHNINAITIYLECQSFAVIIFHRERIIPCHNKS